MASDPSGEIVAAGGFDPYNIYLFSLASGHLLEVIAGHGGPISALAYSATENRLASGSWDCTIRLHDLFTR